MSYLAMLLLPLLPSLSCVQNSQCQEPLLTSGSRAALQHTGGQIEMKAAKLCPHNYRCNPFKHFVGSRHATRHHQLQLLIGIEPEHAQFCFDYRRKPLEDRVAQSERISQCLEC